MLVVRAITAMWRWDGKEEVPVASPLQGCSIHSLNHITGRGMVKLPEELLD
jgi:hypothetical protein